MVGRFAVPETKYARSGDVHVAYQVFGDGPVTFVGVPPVISAIELQWEEPRNVGTPTLEERVDLRAVMDAEGVESAAIGGLSEGGPMCILFAALHPERVSHLLLADRDPRRRHRRHRHQHRRPRRGGRRARRGARARTVKDLVVGSGIDFADRGAHRLKGVPDEWRLFAVRST